MNTKVERMPQEIAHTPPGEGRSQWVLGELVRHKTTSEQTGGAYSLFEVETPPGSGPPPHVQHREDESLYVLEGEYEFLIEGRTIRASAGALIYVPKGTLHAHKNVGVGVGRLLATQTPGGLYERFIEEAGKQATDEATSPPTQGGGLRDLGRLAAIGVEYGLELVPSAP